ncbi:phage tail tape measure protein [Clostridium sp. ZBS4]|uniref:phage tail tape measure protein n=1 Tax=Clostridium sp. ZBS4 TaxID=2949974 RepID=UPI0020792C5C|nr:phage tail tape measure protein [Clostridium sp. ZBS4]
MSDGTVVIDTKLDQTGFEKGLSKLQSTASKGAKLVATSIAGVGAALGGIGAYAIKVGSDFEAGMSKVKAISGATAADMEQLSAKAKEMGAATKFSATESSEALQYMAMAGWKTEQMLNGLPGIMNLAAASGEDLALTSDIVTDAMTAFGMKAEESGHFADILAQASSNSNTNVAMLGESFKYVAPLAGSLGYKAEDTSIALGLMANSGIKASQAGTTLKTALVNMAKPTSNMQTVMDQYGLSLQNTDGSMKSLKEVMDTLREKMGGLDEATKASASATLFGKESLAGMLAVINASPEDYDKLTNAIYECDGASQQMADTMNDNLKGQVVLLKSALEGLGIQLYESVDNPLKNVVASVNEKVGQMSEAFKRGGFNELSKELGNVFAEMATEIAGSAPKMIRASTAVIKSFLKGIKNNSKLITKSAAEIMECLVEAIVELIPEMISIGADIIAGLAKGLSNSIPGLSIILEPLAYVLKSIGDNSELAFKGLIAVGASMKISSSISGLSNAFKGLSSIMATLPSAPVLATIAAIGIGISAYTKEQQALNNTFNVSKEKMGFVEGALLSLNGVQTKSRKELEETGAIYKEFGDNIGNDFKNSVENSTKSIHEFNVALEEITLDGVLDESETKEFNSKVDECVNSALETIKNKKSESQSNMKDLFTLDDGTIDESEQQIIEFLSAEFDIESEEVRKNQEEISKIYSQARSENRTLTEDEISRIKAYYANIKTIELQAQAENNDELEYSKIDFHNRVKNLDATGASELLVQKKSQLNELIIEKENEYDQIIAVAQRRADELSGTEKEAAEEKVQQLKDKKQETIDTYQDEWDKYKEIVEKEAPSIVEEYNKYTGELLTGKDRTAQEGMGYMQQHFENLGSITEEGWYRIYDISDKSMHDVYATVDKNTGEITACWDSTQSIAGGYTNDLKDKVKELGEEHEVQKLTITQGLSEVAGASVNSSAQMVNAIGNVVSELYNMQETSDGTYTAIVNLNGKPVKIETNSDGVITSMHQVGESFDDVTIKADDTSEEVRKKFQAAANDMPSVGSNIVSGIESGIDNNKESLFSKIGGICSSLLNRAKEALDIHSPSRKFRDLIGKNIVAGISVGIEKELPTLLSKVTDVCNEITGAFETLLNANTAQGYIDTISNWGGSFAVLAEELQNAKDAVEISNAKTVDDNKWYSDAKYRLEDVKSQLEELSETISDTEDKSTKESLQTQQKALQKQQKIIQKEVDYYKEAAQEEIDVCKENAKKQLEIAKDKQSKLEQLIKGVTTALKEQLTQQKEAAINAIEVEMDAEEKRYNKKVANIEKSTKRKVEAVQKEIAALDEEKESESRLKEIQESKNNIAVLEAKMANTKSEADKKAYALKIKNAKAELSNKQSDWDREDAKKELQERIDDLNAKADTKKQHLKEDYEETKKHYEKQKKAAEDYYKTLLDTDNLNAQARYVLLTNSNEQLVQLLNSYAPNWQNAGQSLADSLINGLNSKKQDVANAVQELTSLRSKQVSGYATGTSYNRLAGTYTVDEKGFELSTNNNPVAYVSRGAGILNHMQSLKAIKDEVSGQVANQMSILRNMVQGQQQQMYALAGAMAGTTNNSSSIREGDINFNVEHYHNDNKTSIKETAEELGFYAQRKKRC